MTNLNNSAELQRFNRSKVADSLSMLAEQIKDGWQKAKAQKFPGSHRQFSQVVFCGMGGSNLASEFVRSVCADELKKPMVLVRNYKLPPFVGRDSLVIICSYSGNTEEVLACFNRATERRAKIICLSVGGKLKLLAQKNKTPFVGFNEKLNPSRQPRYAVGTQLGTILGIFDDLGILKIKNEHIDLLADYAKTLNGLFGLEAKTPNNPAKQIAARLYGSLPVVVAADFLAANAHIMSNQLNESAKNLAWYNLLPELNHHLLEGLELPKTISAKLKFLFLNSNLYLPENVRRVKATQKVLAKQGIDFIEYGVSGGSRLLSAVEILAFGSWLSFYLAVLNGKEPAGVPWVDFFKKELKK